MGFRNTKAGVVPFRFWWVDALVKGGQYGLAFAVEAVKRGGNKASSKARKCDGCRPTGVGA